MKENITNACNNFLIADLDHDMVGMCKSIVDFLKLLRLLIPDNEIPECVPPENYYKLDPHQPRMDLRENSRHFLYNQVKYFDQINIDEATKLKNLFVLVTSLMLVYHMPFEKMLEVSKISEEFTRKDAQELLLNDNMSPNWLKDPSGQDFSIALV